MNDKNGTYDELSSSMTGGRLRRYAKVTTAMGGLAARLAGEKYLGIKIDREQHASDLRAALGGLKGPLMKVAQILATIPDALPKEYVNELSHLQADAPSMGWLFVKRRMKAELGEDWLSHFKEFEKKASAAASLGQVHFAEDNDGQKLACKLQYPDMGSAVQADLKQLKLIFSLYEKYDSAISTNAIHDELSDRLKEELSYSHEIKNLKLYKYMLSDLKEVTLPNPIEQLSTKRLLTMTRIDGVKIMKFISDNSDIQMRNKVALNMFKAWYIPFYKFGVIHGDPHLGNYTIRPDGGVNLMDFGCIRIFRPDFVTGVIELYQALRDGNEEKAVNAYKSWGFENPSKELISVLNIWANFIYQPLLEDKVRLINPSESGQYGRETAEKVHEELKKIGGVTPPREFVLMDRAAVGLGSVFMHLKAEINWYRIFHELVGDFDEKKLSKRQNDALKISGLVSN
ncbi:AarF/UbiB family protein [Alphaproteobacteria bacterium]|jgi:predicted unusual protein kinase regulating ubiquinone biosynthesis (AarF/ABC1/UbiB family)|nr:AarF/UbiB family protein [Alphaproteobacteria bacterium]MDA9148652.1 AarF/UbiB family protein [Alphaproteobacteria bacterium]MDB2583119.1 AarF/UbiB family protein [Alphaproteobacteria bacterium]MDB2618355.1 AarF/UbiB family protein [Alphaproteobacteria bacterium]MDB2683326.1 AarF/UbiB family protein [Alphaproteobacteria bacterium]